MEITTKIVDNLITVTCGEYSATHESSIDEAVRLLKGKIEDDRTWKEKLLDPAHNYYWFVINGLKGSETKGATKTRRGSVRAFKTKEQAQIFAHKSDLMLEMMQFAHVHNEGWIPKWGGSAKRLYGIREYQETFYLTYGYDSNSFLFGIAVKSAEIGEKMFKEFEDRLFLYNKQY